MLIIKMAWRNIWRNSMRSFVVIGAVVVGIWALIFLSSWMFGMINGYVDNAIRNETSHMQLHHPAFKKDKASKYFMQHREVMMREISALENVTAVSSRTIIMGMLSAARGNTGIRIIGIDAQKEAAVTSLDKKVIEGEYLKTIKGNKIPILVSQKTAEKLKIKLKSNVALQFQTLTGDTRLGCKVVGIYRGINNQIDMVTAFVPQEMLNLHFVGNEAQIYSDSLKLHTESTDIAHEIALLFNSPQQIAVMKDKIQAIAGNYLAEDYREIAPETALMESLIEMMLWVVIAVVMFALIFGIINTMLMAVLERYRELGMLMSVGMGRSKVFLMIVLETVLLSVVGAPLGMLLGAITIYFTQKYGIDLSAFSDAMRQYGLIELIRPEVSSDIYWQISLAIVLTAIVGAIYPAWKAVSLRPVDAIRKI